MIARGSMVRSTFLREIRNSANGHYESVGDIRDAEVIIGHSFGTSTHVDSPNGALAKFILAHENGQPIAVDRPLASAFPRSTQIDLVVEDTISNVTGSEGGTWMILSQTKEFMDEHELSRPLLVAQSHHIGRVAMQARRLGMIDPIIPAGLPGNFDKNSDQPWTRSKHLWIPREVIGAYVLRHQGRL